MDEQDGSTLEEVMMGTVGIKMAFKMAFCDSPCIKLATYKLTLQGESK